MHIKTLPFSKEEAIRLLQGFKHSNHCPTVKGVVSDGISRVTHHKEATDGTFGSTRAGEIVKLFGEALKPKTPSRGRNAKNECFRWMGTLARVLLARQLM